MGNKLLMFCFFLLCANFAMAEKLGETETPICYEIGVCEVPGISQVNYIQGVVTVNGSCVLGCNGATTLYTAYYIPKKSSVSVRVTNPSNTEFRLVYGESACAGWSSFAGYLGFSADGESGDQIVFKTNKDVNSYVFRLQ